MAEAKQMTVAEKVLVTLRQREKSQAATLEKTREAIEAVEANAPAAEVLEKLQAAGVVN